ncbi:hypothetical protein PV10_01848 [Exophiala mesophila]|uniref:UDENN domain-containing protein n=1 Tax=Exophiala mesophila TaxID=212818 RepID=A0A0D2AGV8_EXOME|nr:uncharacterized protein PV10_01848 [Exophiala mesophila]KIV98168.1 hypothetical protein PV10_01848 [Exophiala mesophila]
MAALALSTPQVAVVDFHHARGPEIEFWVDSLGQELAQKNDWSLLPFMALSDGAHTMVEDFSYFALLSKNDDDTDHGNRDDAIRAADAPSQSPSSDNPQPQTTASPSSDSSSATSLFGIACTRQIRSDQLKRRSSDVTRSTVQKAVVVISPTARGMGELRQRVGAVTAAWFAQQDFSDITILKEFQESLDRAPTVHEDGQDHHFGLSLREMIHEFRHQTLALVKCMLLQRKMLFFGSKCERLCMMQFALISLIPGLIRNLQDSADPSLDSYAQKAEKVTTLKTSRRSSLLSYMGLPLQIFGKGSFFGPYTPLQQLDILADYDTKSYVVGSTNSLLLQQKERYSDILINLDESNSINVTSPSLRAALALSAADRRWIDLLTQTVLDTWDPQNPSRPKNHGYAGSEDAIRLQFEEYILSLLSSAAYQTYHDTLQDNNISSAVANVDTYPNPENTAADFNPEFLAMWRTTNNFALFRRLTDQNRIFDIIEPRHPTAGAFNVEDVQRRFQQGVAELHLDERVRESREQLGKTFASGREKVGAGVARFWAEVEKAKEQRALARQVAEQERTDKASRTTSARASVDQTVQDEQGSATESLQITDRTSTTGSPLSPAASNTTLDATRNEGNTADIDNSNQSAPTQGWSIRKPTFQKPAVDTAQLHASARENAAKAGAYFSSWGTWAREKVANQNQTTNTNTSTSTGQKPGEGMDGSA